MLVLYPLSPQTTFPILPSYSESQGADPCGLPHPCPLISIWVWLMETTELFFCSSTQHSLLASPFFQAGAALDSSSPALAHFRLPSHHSLPLQPHPPPQAASGLDQFPVVACPCLLHHPFFVPITSLIPWQTKSLY